MSRKYEARMQIARASESRRENLVNSLREDRRINQVNNWQKTAAQQRWQQQRAAAESESRISQQTREEELFQRRKARRAEQELALADELREQKEKEAGEAAKIALIIQNDPRLKELQSKLKLAYINRARATQLKEKTDFERMMKGQEAALEDEMDRLRAEEEAKSGSALVELRNKQHEQKEFLLKQMQDKRTIIEATATKEYNRDKQNVDSVIQDIIAEQDAEARKKIAKQEETRNFIRQYQVQHAEEKREREEAVRVEDRKILEYQRSKEALEAVKVAKKAEKNAKEQEVYEKILERQEKIRALQDAIVADREVLAEEELEMQEQAKVQARQAEVYRMKLEMIQANESQKAYKKDALSVLAAQEEDVRARMRAKYEEDDRKEARVLSKRASDLRQHKLGIAKQKEDRAVQYELAKQRELGEEQKNREADLFREQVVREAARRLMEEHADVLQNFAPGPFLTSEFRGDY